MLMLARKITDAICSIFILYYIGNCHSANLSCNTSVIMVAKYKAWGDIILAILVIILVILSCQESFLALIKKVY